MNVGFMLVGCLFDLLVYRVLLCVVPGIMPGKEVHGECLLRG